CDLFDDLFDRFWGLEPNSETHSGNSGRSQLSMDAYNEEKSLGMLAGTSAESERESEGRTMSGASAVEPLRRIDLSQMSQADLAELERISQRLLREMSCRVSRRLRTMKSNGLVDMRRTIRRSVCHGGDPIELSYKGRKFQPTKLVILLDISGSMNL